MIKKCINFIFDLFFPKNCLKCSASGFYLCSKCALSIAPPIHTKELLSFIYSACSYKDPIIKRAIWLLKYKQKFDIADDLSVLIYDKMLEEISDLKLLNNFTAPLLVPIPIHNKTLRQRSFNQSEKLAQALVKIDQNQNFIFADALKKTKYTEHQARIRNKIERLKNLKNSFVVKNSKLVKNKNVILIDDVVTTGATLCEARRALKEAGARHIIAFTLAH